MSRVDSGVRRPTAVPRLAMLSWLLLPVIGCTQPIEADPCSGPLTIEPSTVALAVGDSVRFAVHADGCPDSALNLVWASSNEYAIELRPLRTAAVVRAKAAGVAHVFAGWRDYRAGAVWALVLIPVTGGRADPALRLPSVREAPYDMSGSERHR